MDPTGYANYLNTRKAVASGGLALPQGSLLPITSKTQQVGTTAFGVHPSMPEMQGLFATGPARASGQRGHADRADDAGRN